MTSTLGGRFPRARAEPPRETHSAGSHRLRFSRWTRKASSAIHRTQKIDLYFQGVATRRFNHLILVSYLREILYFNL